MKSNFQLVLVGISMALFTLATSAFADGTLRSFTGQTSPLQRISCGSNEVNIRIDVQGNTAQIESNDVPATYTCTGAIRNSGAQLNCTVNANQEAPATFELHVGADRKGSFSFSGTDGSVSANCSF
jgi:hypothetical protein